MALNYIWIAFFVIAFIVAFFRLLFLGDISIFNQLLDSTFESATKGFEISLGLTGVLSLWMGVMKIGERGGIVEFFSRAISPLFSKLFPEVPKGHPVSASILMNISANMLGLDNAATPFGLKAMEELQALNKDKDKASNPMIMFLILNASGLTLIPITIMTYRAQAHAANPSDIFVPLMIATFLSTLVGVTAVCLKQRINMLNRAILGFFGTLLAIIVGVILIFRSMPPEKLAVVSNLTASIILMSIILAFILKGMFRKINVFESFIDGAKDGFNVAIKIIPYLIAILVAVGVFRASGALVFITDAIKAGVGFLGVDTRWIDALPTALMKPLSGSGARGLMIESMSFFGPDSFAGRLACIFQGSTDTTFYIVAVYYGAVNIKNSRYTVPYALLADLAGIFAAIFVCYLFFG